jgi:hypothetical protein
VTILNTASSEQVPLARETKNHDNKKNPLQAAKNSLIRLEKSLLETVNSHQTVIKVNKMVNIIDANDEEEVDSDELKYAEELMARHLRIERKKRLRLEISSKSVPKSSGYSFLGGPNAKTFHHYCKGINEDD